MYMSHVGGGGQADGVPYLMSRGRRCVLYIEVQGMMGNDHIGTPSEQTNAQENITFQQLLAVNIQWEFLLIHPCCDLTLEQIQDKCSDLRTFAYNCSSNTCKCNNHVQKVQVFTLIIMMSLQFKLLQSSSNS